MSIKFTDFDSEKTLIGQMIRKPELIANVYNKLKAEAFSNPTYRRCYEFLLRAFNAGEEIDEVMFAVGCEGVDMTVKTKITEDIITTSNWEYYAERIRQNYLARECNILCNNIVAELTPQNVESSLGKLAGVAGQNLDNDAGKTRMSFRDIAVQYTQTFDERYQHRGQMTGYATGLENIDDTLGGIQKEYIIIAARPSLGKTALAEQMALKMAESMKICFIELEMGEESIFERAVSNRTGISMSKLKSGFMSSAQFCSVVNGISQLGNNENFIFRTGLYDIDDICIAVRAEVLAKKCKAVFIDHAGLIRCNAANRSSWEGFKIISHKLQQLQRELKIPIVVLSQLGREAEGGKPTLANIRGSGAFEEDGDQIWIVDRERQENLTQNEIPVNLKISKNRNGVCCSIPLTFIPDRVKFIDGKKQEEVA